MNKLDETLLHEVVDQNVTEADAYNIRKNGQGVMRKVSENIDIVSKEDGTGIDIYVKENTLFGIVNIPVIITESGLTDVVYNDFHIGKNANVIIIAGCGVHNEGHQDARHDGIHRFFLEENARVNYVEKHYGQGTGTGNNILNPITEVTLKKNAQMKMNSQQMKGVDETNRVTKAILFEGATFIVNEKILTSGNQVAKTEFVVDLNGEGASTHVTSRSVAESSSYQEFISNITGYNRCYAHVECDAILKDQAQVKAIPEIYAKNMDANLIHEAAIGKIAGQQLLKLMSLGMTKTEAENAIIKGFLK